MMDAYREKIKNRDLTTNDIDLIISEIELIMKEKRRGYTELSDDDIEQLKIFRFFLSNYEENNKSVNFSTRTEHLNHHKVKNIIDELELNQIITKPLGDIGGRFYFEILDKVRYRDYILKSIELIINKIPRKTLFGFLGKLDWYNPYVVGFGVTVFGGLLLLIFWNMITSKPEPVPGIQIDSISFSPTTFLCGQYSNFDVTYKVGHVSGEGVGFGYPYYVLINQTKNTCLENFTFFNGTPSAHCLSFNKISDGKEEIAVCSSNVEPLFHKTITVKSNLNDLAYRMIDVFRDKNVSDCELSEQVKICAIFDDKDYCSSGRTVDITYVGCKS